MSTRYIIAVGMVVAGAPTLPQAQQPAEPKAAAEMRREGTLKAGDPAPDFDLAQLSSEARVRLSSFKGQQPVALIFGATRDRRFGRRSAP